MLLFLSKKKCQIQGNLCQIFFFYLHLHTDLRFWLRNPNKVYLIYFGVREPSQRCSVGSGGAFMPWKLSKSAILVDFWLRLLEQVFPNPFQYMTPNFLLITNMSHNSRGTKKTQIALIKCVRGGQGTKKTRKKLPGNGIFSDLNPLQANIYTYIHIYIDIYI